MQFRQLRRALALRVSYIERRYINADGQSDYEQSIMVLTPIRG
jgi:hypothetical protein